MLKNKESRKKIQPALNDEPLSPEGLNSDRPLSKSGDPQSQPLSPTNSNKKSRMSGMHLSPSGINLVNLPEGGAAKSHDSTRKNGEGGPSARHSRRSGGSILKKSRIANPESTNRLENGPVQGEEIRRSRRHKISFKENIEQVNVVENWKEYNADDYTSNATCYCQMF